MNAPALSAVAALVERPPEKLEDLLAEVARLPWPDTRGPELAKLAESLDRRALVEALDQPGPARLGAIRLLGLL